MPNGILFWFEHLQCVSFDAYLFFTTTFIIQPIFDIAGIALKFVDGEYMRKLLGMRKAQHIENPYNGGNREINGFGNRSERTLTSELINYMSNQAACHAVVSRDKGMLFGEAFAAMGTAVSSAPVIEDNGLTESGNILDKLPAVIMDI